MGVYVMQTVVERLVREARVYDKEEIELRRRIAALPVEQWGVNLDLAERFGLQGRDEYIDFYLALRRREYLQEVFFELRQRVAARRLRIYAGDTSMDTVIVDFIYFFYGWGYSQAAIAEVLDVSTSTVHYYVKQERKNKRLRSQIIEMLPSMNQFRRDFWVVKENSLTTGVHLTKAQSNEIFLMLAGGYTVQEIVRHTGYSEKAVRFREKKMGRR